MNRSKGRRDAPRKYSNSEEDESRSRSRSRSEERPTKRRSRRDSSGSNDRSSRRKETRSRNRDQSRSQSPKEKGQDDCSELFVRNLPWKADEQSISEFFSKYGKVENVKILFDKFTGKAKGIGFVNFESRSDAENVIRNGDDLEIDGRKVEVNFSNQRKERPQRDFGRDDRRGDDRRDNRRDDRREREPNPETKTIFVGNLSFKTDDNSIRDFFEGCGNIEDIRVAMGHDGKSKGFAHLEFDSVESASKAMRKNGENLDGRDVRVDFSAPRREGGNRDRFGGGRDGGRDGGFRGGRGGRGGSRGGSRGYNRDRY
jgi:nucleolin